MAPPLERHSWRLLVGALLGAGLLLAWWDGGAEGEAVGDHACAGAEWEDGWCEVCEVGHLAGIPIRSQVVYDALDAHGHDYQVESITCASCREAIPHEGFCQACRRGFWRDQLFFSQLSYQVARAARAEAGDCSRCVALRGAAGWCERSGRGWIGHVAIERRADFERAHAAYRVLLAALDEAARCELCAAAMTVDGTCPTCRIAYEAGEGRPLPRRR